VVVFVVVLVVVFVMVFVTAAVLMLFVPLVAAAGVMMIVCHVFCAFYLFSAAKLRTLSCNPVAKCRNK
jgi:hypothetical protein